MPDMQQIKDAVCEYQLLTLRVQLFTQFYSLLEREQFCHHSPPDLLESQPAL